MGVRIRVTPPPFHADGRPGVVVPSCRETACALRRLVLAVAEGRRADRQGLDTAVTAACPPRECEVPDGAAGRATLARRPLVRGTLATVAFPTEGVTAHSV